MKQKKKKVKKHVEAVDKKELMPKQFVRRGEKQVFCRCARVKKTSTLTLRLIGLSNMCRTTAVMLPQRSLTLPHYIILCDYSSGIGIGSSGSGRQQHVVEARTLASSSIFFCIPCFHPFLPPVTPPHTTSLL